MAWTHFLCTETEFRQILNAMDYLGYDVVAKVHHGVGIRLTDVLANELPESGLTLAFRASTGLPFEAYCEHQGRFDGFASLSMPVYFEVRKAVLSAGLGYTHRRMSEFFPSPEKEYKAIRKVILSICTVPVWEVARDRKKNPYTWASPSFLVELPPGWRIWHPEGFDLEWEAHLISNSDS